MSAADLVPGADALDPMRMRIIAEARTWLGTPYHHQASVKGVGCDCLGLVRGVWRAIHGDEPEETPPYTPDWAEAGKRETLAFAARRHFDEIDIGAALPADILLFRWRSDLPAKHVAILTPGDNIIHAHEGNAVAEVPFGVWRPRIAYAFRFPGAN